MKPILVYGANGRTGRRVATLLRASGWPLIVTGRSGGALEVVARELGVEARVVSVDDPAALSEVLRGAYAVVNCAGPFVETARPLAEACLGARVHYLDVSTERTAIRALLDLHEPARSAGVKIVPAVGATGALGAWARALANEYAETPLREIDISYAHGGASFLRPTAGALRSFAKEVLHMIAPENGGYRLVPRRVEFPLPFGLGHAIQSRGPDDILLPTDPHPAVVRTWLSVDPGTALNAVWTLFHEPSLSRVAAPAVHALWRAAADASLESLAKVLPSSEEDAWAVVIESNGPRVSVASSNALAATGAIVALCLNALDQTPSGGVIAAAALLPARSALRTLARSDVVRVFRGDRSQ